MAHSKERRKQIEKELEGPEGRFQRTQGRRWQAEKSGHGKIRKLKEQIENSKRKNRNTSAPANWPRCRIRYGKIAAAERDLKKRKSASPAVQKDAPMLKEEVDEEDIAKLVSKWTGIPTGLLLEGEAQKLVHMRNGCGSALLARIDASGGSRMPCGAAAQGSPTSSGRSARSFFLGPTGVGKTETGSSAGGVSLRRRKIDASP